MEELESSAQVNSSTHRLALSQQSGRSSIDQLLRTTHQHHIYLSGMADKKASFLIAAASVMLTLILGKYSDENTIPAPLLILAGFTLLATCFAVLCIVPHLKSKQVDREKINLLFFGEFGNLSLEDYKVKMASLIQSDEDIYQAIIEEIYFLGELLKKTKYRYLTWAYQIFLAGILLSAFIFAGQVLSVVNPT
ncbi:MAG: DUF5706 domain-containing protein [Kangiellaceae bacterium]|nr:DUF5706 domain-containing protein [Kangiellaceae bacterium]MCW8997818.1 DUF5706 domain-containing protein [Kangiellaceae bacterium]